MQGKHILIGVTGSIAAYKAAILVRLLIRDGAQVRVVMSRAAKDFITPLTLATLCKSPILVDNFDPENGAWNSHISLGEWADHYIIAPATANTIAKMAHGVADNLLLCTYLSARCPVSIAPAMDYDMYLHPTTQSNIEYLRSLGVGVFEPDSGFLASGLTGKGRMQEPEEIVTCLKNRYFSDAGANAETTATAVTTTVIEASTAASQIATTADSVTVCSQDDPIRGRKILVTAGATIEAIDPVRYISNHSTGKMGYAIADALARRGAQVTLISGSVTARLEHPHGITIVKALSAEQMYRATSEAFPSAECAIFCAAVADYTPTQVAQCKIKHNATDELILRLRPTHDIAAEMGRIKRPEQFTIGFALETDHAESHARRKLHAKNLDAIVLNTLEDSGAGFGVDTNRITIIDHANACAYPLRSKTDVAVDIVEYLAERLKPTTV